MYSYPLKMTLLRIIFEVHTWNLDIFLTDISLITLFKYLFKFLN